MALAALARRRRGRISSLWIGVVLASAPVGAQEAPSVREPQAPEVRQPPAAPLVPPSEASTTSPAAPPSPLVARASSDVAAYGDTDHVFVFTPSIAGSVENPTAGWSVGGSYLVDVVSAASVDIVSTASRRWEEVRQAGTLDASYKPRSFGVEVSGSVSVEPDYTSVTGGFVLTQDLLDKNLTLLGGYEHGHDIAGITGTPFSVFAHVIDHDAFKAGATLVLDPSTLLTGIAEADFERGDTSKPYRYIPLFAPGTTVTNGESVDQVNAARLSERVIEQLPLSRDRYALTGRLAHRFSSSTLRLDERLYADSWALFATSTDARYLVDATPRFQIGPHARFHAQKAVSFWERAYVLEPGLSYPAIRTGDRELGPLVNATAGGSARLGFGPSYQPMKWSLGLDVDGTYTWYLDDLYITYRVAVVGGVSLQGEL